MHRSLLLVKLDKIAFKDAPSRGYFMVYAMINNNVKVM